MNLIAKFLIWSVAAVCMLSRNISSRRKFNSLFLSVKTAAAARQNGEQPAFAMLPICPKACQTQQPGGGIASRLFFRPARGEFSWCDWTCQNTRHRDKKLAGGLDMAVYYTKKNPQFPCASLCTTTYCQCMRVSSYSTHITYNRSKIIKQRPEREVEVGFFVFSASCSAVDWDLLFINILCMNNFVNHMKLLEIWFLTKSF